jgi:hypothetical protein
MLFSCPENGDGRFLTNVTAYLLNYAAAHLRRQKFFPTVVFSLVITAYYTI